MKVHLSTLNSVACSIDAPCFQNLTQQEIDLVRSSKSQLFFEKGDTITKQGAFSSSIFFVTSGIARQYLEDESARSLNLTIVREGDFIGLSSLFAGNIYSYSVVALTHCRVVIIEKEVIRKIIMNNSEFSFNITQRYCRQNNSLYETLAKVAFKQMNGRLAETLLYLNGLKDHHPDIFQLLSRKDLAGFAALSTESTVKLLKSFEREGLITLKGKDIEILNPAILSEFSKRG